MVLRFDTEALLERARNLGPLNGFKLVFVSLEAAPRPSFAWLDVEFQNDQHLAPPPPATDFTLSGGTRLRAGANPGEIQVTQVLAGATPRTLRLKVAPVGDYSTYTLSLRRADFDPLFSDLPFKFRPGCFNLNCAPDWDAAPAPPDEPAIDYLARDYDSFRHVLIAAMMQRVPNWQPTSEADFDQVLIDLLAADGDELADFQDRVMSEAYLTSARKRVSLARHARLMDYHIHEGNQAGTWLAIQVSIDDTLPAPLTGAFGVWTHDKWSEPGCVIFASETDQACFRRLNELLAYGWGGTVNAIEAGSTSADLTVDGGLTQAAADALRNTFLLPDVHHLLIQEELNPETGTINGRDPTARQVVRLLPLGGPVPRAESVADPVPDPVTLATQWMVRVRWVAEDRLQRRYCTVTRCPGQPVVTGVTKFFGNLLWVTQGRPRRSTFRPPGAPLGGADESRFVAEDEAAYEVLEKQVGPVRVRTGTMLPLPKAPLAYRNTLPGGDAPTRSTLTVTVQGFADPWAEQSDLIESQGDDEHFIVETDELGISRVRFGDGINGAALADDAVVECRYRVGQGEAGNVGADRLSHFDPAGSAVTRVWNPLDVVDGRSPEPPAEILRRVPEAYRRRQKRAVTLADYAARAAELPGVAQARAHYGWTGSWRTVRVAIDPAGTTVLDPALRLRIADHLDALRLIGEDLEVRPAHYVPLDIKLRLCADPRYWPEDLRAVLEIEFSDGYTPDGRRGFFHPDQWSFGQPLHASQIVGRALAVTGVERVLSLSMRRWNPGSGGGLVLVTLTPDQLPDALVEKLAIGPFEILEVANDPSRLETGRMLFEILGGRR
jgi:hypothetical protein